MTGRYGEPMRLAAEALRAEIDNRRESARRYLVRLYDECGWDGLVLGMLAICDTLHDHATDGDMWPRRIAPPAFADIATGALIEEPPAPAVWAARLVAARATRQEPEYVAVLNELVGMDDVGLYVSALLTLAGATMRAFPRGYVDMGREQVTP